MKKNVWIMNHYAGSMLKARGGRHYWFADHLHRAGYQPVVFCCNVSHDPGTETFYENEALWSEHRAEEIGVPFVFVRSNTYIGNGKDRIRNMWGFYRNVLKAARQYAAEHGAPDVIYASSVHPLTLVAGLKLAKHFLVRCVCEVRDLWPETLVVYSERLRRSHLLKNALYAGEKWIYKKSDALIFTQMGGPDYLRSKKWDREQGGPIDMKKVHYINNGVDLEAFDNNLRQYRLNDSDLDGEDTFKFIYTGSIRRVNALGQIVDAAKEIRDPRISILVFGSGDDLEMLRERVEKEGLRNIRFKGRVDKQAVPYILSRADVNLVHWQMTPLLKYGESGNKIFEYFAAGKPVYYTVRPTYSLVEAYDCGCTAAGFSPKELAEGMEHMAALPGQELDRMAKNARRAAQDYDFKNLTAKLIDVIESV